ncbi:MAG: ABC transporter ATP-binding protein [Planctomicrobium sp.]|nr:ABC transporter ATP-binding protein [Planctomicrobium sp.]
MSETNRPLRRLLPKRHWTDSQARGMFLWSMVYTACAVVGLILIVLLIDLLTHFRMLSELHTTNVQIKQELKQFILANDIGLWVQAIRFDESFGWFWLPWFCRSVPFASSSPLSLVMLVISGLLVTLLLLFARSRARRHAHQAATTISTSLRKAIHRQTLRLGPGDLTGQRHLVAHKLFTETIDEIRDALVQFRWRLTRGACLVPVMLIASLCIDWRLAIQCLVPTIASWWLYRYERSKGAAQRSLAESRAETEARFLADGLKKTRIVRGYNMEEFEGALFENHLLRLTTDKSAGRRLEHNSLRVARLFVAVSIAVVMLLIGLRVLSPSAPLPLAFGVALLASLAILAREATSLEFAVAQRRFLLGESERVYRFLDEIPDVGQAVGAKFIEPVAKSIILESVHYRHRGHEILKGLDLRIEAKSQVALVSLDSILPKAIAYLLPRFIEPSQGRVMFDGEDIAWGTLESIHAETSYVGGDDPVLSGTVLENLICGDSRFTMQEAIEAAKTVHVNKFISSLPLGYETTLGEHGQSIGIGEAFQIGLARAVLRNPAVLIIQEPEAILEESLRVAIDDAYQRISQSRTVIFLPSRLSTIRRCDQVVLLHDGKVEGLGTHQELRKASDLYRHWDYINFNSFSRESRRLKAKGSGI